MKNNKKNEKIKLKQKIYTAVQSNFCCGPFASLWFSPPCPAYSLAQVQYKIRVIASDVVVGRRRTTERRSLSQSLRLVSSRASRERQLQSEWQLQFFLPPHELLSHEFEYQLDDDLLLILV